MTAGSFAAVLKPLAVLGPLAGIVASLSGALPARGAEVPFTERVISTTAAFARSVFAVDVDGDGDIDILSASRDDDKIAWYENNPTSPGSPPSFTEHVIIERHNGGEISVFATDLDGDGDTDVLSASIVENKITWYENNPTSPGNPPTFTERVISTTASLARSVFATDVDGDGDTDVLSASFDKIAWYESDSGLIPTFTERVISTTANASAISVFATDLDGDGDIDVLSASADKIAWYENELFIPPNFDADNDGDVDMDDFSRFLEAFTGPAPP